MYQSSSRYYLWIWIFKTPAAIHLKIILLEQAGISLSPVRIKRYKVQGLESDTPILIDGHALLVEFEVAFDVIVESIRQT